MTEMSVIFDANTDPEQAQTHVIIIGVSKYDHLPGGKGTMLSDNLGLGQLSSPSVSARAMADWFVKGNFDNPARPLGTVSLVLSEHSDRLVELAPGRTVKVPEATSVNTKRAIIEWFEKCQQNPENLAIFYYCGHGISSGSVTSLLLQNFGENPYSVLDDALDLTKLQHALDYSNVGKVIWFIDACRTNSSLLASLNNYSGMCPISPARNARLNLQPVQSHVYYSSLRGTKSYGRKEMVSEFTSALLKGLGGHAAKRKAGEWWINTFELSSVIQQHLSVSPLGRDVDQRSEIERQSLFDLSRSNIDMDTADAYVTTEQAEFWNSVDLRCLADDSEIDFAKGEELAALNKGAWEIRLRAKMYTFQARWPKALGKPESEEPSWITPPVQFVTIKG